MASAAPAASDSKSDVDVSQVRHNKQTTQNSKAPPTLTLLHCLQFVIKTSMSVAQLKCSEAFDGLTDQEKAYAHHVAAASWEGSKVNFQELPNKQRGLTLIHGHNQSSDLLAAVLPRGACSLLPLPASVWRAVTQGVCSCRCRCWCQRHSCQGYHCVSNAVPPQSSPSNLLSLTL